MDDQPEFRFTKDWSDTDRLDFLKELDGADKEVTDWEAEFIASMLQRARNVSSFTKTFTMTLGQRKVVENMQSKYRL